MKWIKYKRNNDVMLPIYSWSEYVEENAMDQAIALAKHKRLFHHVGLMADTHMGYGMPIGGVIAVSEALIPNAVGYDIGCGMIAVCLGALNLYDMKFYRQLCNIIKKEVPVGFNKHKTKQKFDMDYPDIEVVKENIENAYHQIGTLGGGNHFIEIQVDADGILWLMIHSGSRNMGYKIAEYYNKKALCYCDDYNVEIPNKDLAYLDINHIWCQEYIKAMDFALEFAHENRKRMLNKILDIISSFIYIDKIGVPINIHHNFASIEKHFGKNVWIHRKGATQAKVNMMGIIPGSMGTSSYIVKGLGNKDSFESCSHGAGRILGRNQASRTLKIEDCNESMKGIVFDRWKTIKRRKKKMIDLGESPLAYKNIDNVIKSQLDLIKIMIKLKPLAVVKG